MKRSVAIRLRLAIGWRGRREDGKAAASGKTRWDYGSQCWLLVRVVLGVVVVVVVVLLTGTRYTLYLLNTGTLKDRNGTSLPAFCGIWRTWRIWRIVEFVLISGWFMLNCRGQSTTTPSGALTPRSQGSQSQVTAGNTCYC